MAYVICQCKIHCVRYNPETNTYTPGELVTRTTAVNHRLDENRSTAHRTFSANIATSILEDGPLGSPQESFHESPLAGDFLDQEFLTLEYEIGDRSAWAPSNRQLVFALDIIPHQHFQPPTLNSRYLPNSGPHALHPSYPTNLAFFENENRLFEILVKLEATAWPEDLRERLVDAVESGLQRMWSHKESEWDRQRCRAVAVAGGHCLVDNGEYPFARI